MTQLSHCGNTNISKEVKPALKEYLHFHIYCSTVRNYKNKKLIQMFTIDEWINKMWNISTMEYNSIWFLMKWIELEIIMANGKKTKTSIMFYLLWGNLNMWVLYCLIINVPSMNYVPNKRIYLSFLNLQSLSWMSHYVILM